MGRSSVIPSFVTDFLQSFPFWLFDIAPVDQFGLPLFLPIFGFSRATAPEMTTRIKVVKEGNWHFDRKIISGATVSPLTLERGVLWTDSDFWRWMQAAVFGDPELFGGIPGPTVRRDLLLIHFFSRGPIPLINDDLDLARSLNFAAGVAGTIGVASAGVGLSANSEVFPLEAAGNAALAVSGQAAVNALLPGSTFRVPAKAWLLSGCIPSRYKVASDFDALSSAISLTELDLEYERFEEISLAA